jgi:hypothetical protein
MVRAIADVLGGSLGVGTGSQHRLSERRLEVCQGTGRRSD